MFYNARYYDSTIGRFTQADTIVPNLYNPQSLNRYAYVRNNPVKYTDPTGHEYIPRPDQDDGNDGGSGHGSGASLVPKPPIVSREEWGALRPGIHYICGRGVCISSGWDEGYYDHDQNGDGYALYSIYKKRMSLSDILDTIVIHHEGNWQTYDIRSVQSKHMFERGMWDIAYHYVIGQDGTIYEGRDVGVRGRHVEESNTGKIGVLFLGDFEPGWVLNSGT
ncbi:MAG: N-acetylmuramoyl-L-alanine amidase [Chloroflexi bacterium]|nr:N-acetylmuramoyl-L-alanine amidase [Chloroflexota bacterium]